MKWLLLFLLIPAMAWSQSKALQRVLENDVTLFQLVNPALCSARLKGYFGERELAQLLNQLMSESPKETQSSDVFVAYQGTLRADANYSLEVSLSKEENSQFGIIGFRVASSSDLAPMFWIKYGYQEEGLVDCPVEEYSTFRYSKGQLVALEKYLRQTTYDENQQVIGEEFIINFETRKNRDILGYSALMGRHGGLMEKAEARDSYRRRPVLAILDSGYDYNHSHHALYFMNRKKTNLWIQNWENAKGFEQRVEARFRLLSQAMGYDLYDWDFLPEEKADAQVVLNQEPDSEHGTAAAGILGGGAPVKIVPMSGIRAEPNAHNFAVKLAYLRGARVLNFSFGSDDHTMLALMRSMEKNQDILFTVAAQNWGEDLEKRNVFPAMVGGDNTLVVANIKSSGELHESSGYSDKHVDLAEEGHVLAPSLGTWENFSGTSGAAPSVGNLAGRLLIVNPYLMGKDLKTIIMQTVVKLPPLTGKVKSGGRPDRDAAIALARSLRPASLKNYQLQTRLYRSQIQNGKLVISGLCDFAAGPDVSVEVMRGVNAKGAQVVAHSIAKCGANNFFEAQLGAPEMENRFQFAVILGQRVEDGRLLRNEYKLSAHQLRAWDVFAEMYSSFFMSP